MKKIFALVALIVLATFVAGCNTHPQPTFEEKYIPLEFEYDKNTRIARFWEINGIPEDHESTIMVRYDGKKAWVPMGGNPFTKEIESADKEEIPVELKNLLPENIPQLIELEWNSNSVFHNTENCTTYIGYTDAGYRLGTEEDARKCFSGAEKVEIWYFLSFKNCTIEQFSGSNDLRCQLGNVMMEIGDTELQFVIRENVNLSDVQAVKEVLDFEGISSSLPAEIKPDTYYRLAIP